MDAFPLCCGTCIPGKSSKWSDFFSFITDKFLYLQVDGFEMESLPKNYEVWRIKWII